MQNKELEKLAQHCKLDSDDCFNLRIAFAIACVERVEHLAVDQKILCSLETGRQFLAGNVSKDQLMLAASVAAEAARSQAGTNSMDGSGSAAVSSGHAVAAALAGRALDAASYAAYAKVYSYASYAVTNPSAYSEEHQWQLSELRNITAMT